jgi:hypothetical protein
MIDTNTGLEFIKIIASVATPIIVLVLGIWAKTIAIDYERRASLNGRVIEKRIEIYGKVDKDLNDIFVFLTQVGNWKALTPEEIVMKKREVDKIMHTNRPYWSDVTFNAYREFMNSAFETYTGVCEDAKIKTELWQFRKLPSWQESWSKWYSPNPTSLSELRSKYNTLMKSLAGEFGYYQKS